MKNYVHAVCMTQNERFYETQREIIYLSDSSSMSV